MVVVSFKNKFIFIKRSINASTSIEEFLSQFAMDPHNYSPYIKTDEDESNWFKKYHNFGINIDDYGLVVKNRKEENDPKITNKLSNKMDIKKNTNFKKCYNHMSYESLSEMINLRDYIIVSTIRNPWDRTVSIFYKDMYRNCIDIDNPIIQFTSWILNKKNRPDDMFEKILDKNKKPICDIYIRFEHIYNDIKIFLIKYLKKTNIEAETLLENLPEFKIHVRKDKNNYKKYYNNVTKNIVKEWYKKEILLGNYTF